MQEIRAMANILKDAGVDMEVIRKDFFASNTEFNAKESIKNSRAYIVIMCTRQKTRIWDFVQAEMTDIDNDPEIELSQKPNFKASLLLAWEELERDEPHTVLNIQQLALDKERAENRKS